MPKTLKIFITQRTNNQIETLDKHDISIKLQTHIANYCKFVNNAYDNNRVMLSNQFTEKMLSFDEIDIPKHVLLSKPDWKVDDVIPKLCVFSHSIRDVTYENFVDFLNLNNALNNYWLKNIPDKAQMLQPNGSRITLDIPKDKKEEMKKMKITKYLEESIQTMLYSLLTVIVNDKINAAIVQEYEPLKTKK